MQPEAPGSECGAGRPRRLAHLHLLHVPVQYETEKYPQIPDRTGNEEVSKQISTDLEIDDQI